jgi:hypothetical protein
MKYITVLLLIALLCGCDQIKEKLHLMPNQDEQACLNSERFNFKDPDVLFVANLGNRGMKLKQDQYWVRYKAKNSYGAYIQGNMLCEKNSKGEWVNSKADQYFAASSIQIYLLQKVNERMKSGDKEVFEQFKYKKSTQWAEEEADRILLHSAENISPYLQEDSITPPK